jgi:hypothetical protein
MKKDIKRTIKELKEYRDNLLREMDSLDHVLECSLENYNFMIDFAIKGGYKTVVDIGCAYGHQAELCKDRIKYIGIDEDNVDFYKETLNRGYIVGKYPCYIPTYYYNSLAISNLAIGWNCYVNEKEFDKQCKELKKDFKASLLYIPKDRESILRKNFENVMTVKEDKEYSLGAFYYCK